jgi:hypothetical protein
MSRAEGHTAAESIRLIEEFSDLVGTHILCNNLVGKCEEKKESKAIPVTGRGDQ